MKYLKQCPFCGNEVEVEKTPLWDAIGRGYYGCYEFKIKCKNCGCTVNQPKNDSIYRSEEKARENAIEAWNRRATADVVERKSGRWIVDEDGNIECSVCGHHGVGDLYCERCGAQMEVK